jgi:hypothetical protein
MLCCCCLEILNGEIRFYKWYLMGQWNMSVNKGDISNVCLLFSIAPFSNCVQDVSLTKNSSGPMMYESSQSFKAWYLYWVNRVLTAQEGFLSIPSRTCLWCRKMAMMLWETQLTKNPSHMLSFSCYFPFCYPTTYAESDDIRGKKRESR